MLMKESLLLMKQDIQTMVLQLKMITLLSVMRPVFEIEGEIYVSAGFIPIFRDKANNTMYMLQKRKDKPYYEDLGGKSDKRDKCIADIVIRETLEELNWTAPEKSRPNPDYCPFTPQTLPDILADAEQILIPSSKYVLYLADIDFMDVYLNTDHYGPAELNTDGTVALPRDIAFLTSKEMSTVQLHPRIKNCLPFILSDR